MTEEVPEIRPIEELLDEPFTDAELRHYGMILAQLTSTEGWAVFERMMQANVGRILRAGLTDMKQSRQYLRGRLEATEAMLRWVPTVIAGGMLARQTAKDEERWKGVHPNLRTDDDTSMEGVALPFHSMFDTQGE